jgi:RNA polymerase sigma factor (sigma-70 family)
MTRYAAAPILRHLRRLAADRPALPTDADCLERFAARRDEAAFETLVRRHGPMVLRVCRSILGDLHAAEDAFQTTFLALARRVAAVRRGQSLAGWLYTVARRAALRAANRAAERLRQEAAAARRPVADPGDEISWREVRAIFFDELAKLPESYRIPVLQCCLEGMARDEAAARAGVAPGTFKIRLERARKLLRDRLARRGLGLSVGLLTTLLDSGEATAVPPSLVERTVRAGASAAASGAVAAALAGRAFSLVAVLTLAAAGIALFLYRAEPHGPAVAEASEPGSGGVRERIDPCGDPLPPEALSRLGTLRFRTGGRLVAVTPDGKTLVTHGAEVRAMDLASGKHIRSFPAAGATGPPMGVALSPDGKRLAAVDSSGIRLVDFTTGKLLQSFGSGDCHSVRFSPDGKLVAAVRMNSPKRQVELREVDTGKEVWSWTPGKLPLCSVAFTPDGQTLIAGGWAFLRTPPLNDNTIRLVDVRTGKERQRIDMGTEVPGRIVVSPDGTLFATDCSREPFPQRIVRVWEVNGGRQVRVLESPDEDSDHQKYLTSLAFAPGGKSLLTSGSGDCLIEWDLATGKELRRIGRRMLNCSALEFTPDGKSVVTTCAAPVVRVIDWASGEVRSARGGNFGVMQDAAFSPDGRSLTTVAAGRLSSWDLLTGRERHHADAVLPPESRLSPDGRSAFGFETFTRDGAQKGVVVWDTATGQARARIPLEIPGDQPSFAACTPGTNELAVADYFGRTVHLLDTATGKPVARLHDPEMKARYAEFAAAGRLLVAFCTDHAAVVWDVARRKKLRRIELVDVRADKPDPALRELMPYAFAVSPDGTRIVYGSQMGYVRLFDATTGEELRRYNKLRITLGGFAFSPDCRTLARAGGGDTSIHLIELATGKERHCLTGHSENTERLRFSPDGRLLVSCGGDTTALVWDLTGRHTNPAAGKPLARAELDTLWASLAGDDAVKAYDAIRTLAAAPAHSLPFLAERLHPVESAAPGRIARLFADLDGDEFAAREKAASELEKLGETASAAIRKTLAGRPSAEVRRHLEEILARHEEDLRNPSGERLRGIRALEALELNGDRQARAILQVLGGGSAEARLTQDAKASLARLARHAASEP